MHRFFYKRSVAFCLLIFIAALPKFESNTDCFIENIYYEENFISLSYGLNYSTYFGGNSYDISYSIATTSDDGYYIAGFTGSSNFPVKNAFNDTFGGESDAFVAKFASNNTLLWGTYFGGSNKEAIHSIAVDINDSCYVTGKTWSSDFPVLNAYDNNLDGERDAFVAKFSVNGSLLWSTYLGGNNWDHGFDIAVVNNSYCYVTGSTWSANFPMLNPLDSTLGGSRDAFVAKFSTNGLLLWSTFLGGNDLDDGFNIALEINNSCYVSGFTTSADFPTLNAYNSTYGGDGDGFITKFNENGSLLWSTFLGGNEYEYGIDIAVATNGSCFLTGKTQSNDFPTLDAYDGTINGGNDVFVTKFSTNGSLLWSTFLGGNSYDVGSGIAVDSNGSCYVTGETSSSNFPTMKGYDSSFNGYYDVYIAKFSVNGTLVWSTYLGGGDYERGLCIAIGKDERCIIAGQVVYGDFPVESAYDDSFNLGPDVFVSIFCEVNDTFSPSIIGVHHMPLTPFYDEVVTINCIVSDICGIQSVILNYQVNSNSWTTKEFVKLPGDNFNDYTAFIGPFNANSVVKYYIEATDNSVKHNLALDNNNTNYYQFLVLPSWTSPSTLKTTIQLGLTFGFVAFIIIEPILVIILHKKRK